MNPVFSTFATASPLGRRVGWIFAAEAHRSDNVLGRFALGNQSTRHQWSPAAATKGVEEAARSRQPTQFARTTFFCPSARANHDAAVSGSSRTRRFACFSAASFPASEPRVSGHRSGLLRREGDEWGQCRPRRWQRCEFCPSGTCPQHTASVYPGSGIVTRRRGGGRGVGRVCWCRHGDGSACEGRRSDRSVRHRLGWRRAPPRWRDRSDGQLRGRRADRG